MLFLEWDLLHGHVFRFSVDEDDAAFFFVSNLAVIFLFYPIGKLAANHFRHDALSMGFGEQSTESAHFFVVDFTEIAFDFRVFKISRMLSLDPVWLSFSFFLCPLDPSLEIIKTRKKASPWRCFCS